MKKLLITITILLTSCTAEISPELQPIVDDFIEDAALYGWPVKRHINRMDRIKVVDTLPEDTLGRSYGNYMILISDKLVNKNQLRATVYHELGHNVFGLEHCACYDFSIMNGESTLDPSVYDYLWDACVYELFKQVEENYCN